MIWEENVENVVSLMSETSERKWVCNIQYLFIAFVLWVDDTAMKKVSKVHDLRGEQTCNQPL